MPHYLIKNRLKGFRKAGNQSYRAVVRRIGAVTLSTDRLNVSKLPARRIGRSRETRTKEFDQAGSEFRSTAFETTGGLHLDHKPSKNQSQRGHGKRYNEEF